MYRRSFLVFTIFISLVIEFYGQSGTIKGRVFNKSTNEPLPFTNIIISGTQIGSTSDFEGNFTFTGIEPGFYRLKASSVGYESKITEEFQLTNAKTVNIDIPMEQKSQELEEVVVEVSPFKEKDESPVSMRTLTVSEIEKNPGANRDISRVIQAFPGVASSVSFRNDVIVRGGSPSENSFYLDGIEIPNLNHFATQGASGGPVGIINVDFIREVDYYAGAFPANRGGALSSVLEFRQINGNQEAFSARATLGASDLALTVDGPIGEKTTMIASARRSYLQFLFDVIGLPFLPVYNDFQFKTKTRLNKKNELSFIGLGAIDEFSLNTDIENPDESQRYILRETPVNEQWNYTIGAIYRHYGKNGYSSVYLSRNMLDNSAYKYPENNENKNKILDFTSQEIENKLRFEQNERRGDFKLIYGAGLEYAKYFNDFFQQIYTPETGLDNLEYQSSLKLFKWETFAQVSRKFLQDRLTLSFGTRMDATDYSSSMNNMFEQFSPRFSASYDLYPELSLNFNTGRFYQLPAYTTLGYKNNEGELVNKQNNLKYIAADHIVAGLAWYPQKDAKITLEGFYKKYSDYPFSLKDSISLANKGADFGRVGDVAVKSISEGRAYGIELLARDRSTILDLNAILSYTYVRSEFKAPDGKYSPSSWDNIHLLNLTLRKELKNNWDIGIKFRYVGGAPYTPWDIRQSSIKKAWDSRSGGVIDYSRLNQKRLEGFQQLDIRVDKAWYFDNWSLMLYLDIQNAYNYQAETEPNLVRKLDNGKPIIINDNGISRYDLKRLSSTSGTILPTIGIMIEI
ncbi:MAG: TonB-dependent receptor [Bacteroidales bacterium]|nr:TonB-dependent receptor [Bacteroidales bacterium]